MTEAEVKVRDNNQPDKERIDRLGKEYYYAKKEGRTEATKLRFELLNEAIVKKNSLNKKLYEVIRKNRLDESDMYDFCEDLIPKYDYEKCDSVYAYLIQYFRYEVSNKKRKMSREKLFDPTSEEYAAVIESDDRYGERDDLMNESPDNILINRLSQKEKEKNVYVTLLSLVISFNEHNKGLKANPVRQSYYRIFFTERLIAFIRRVQIPEYINKRETYENSDKAFVRFVSYSDYKCLEDILDIKYKMFSEVIEDYSKKDKRIELPVENEIIVSYRVKCGLDSKAVSSSNVTQQRNHFDEAFREKFNMIESDY